MAKQRVEKSEALRVLLTEPVMTVGEYAAVTDVSLPTAYKSVDDGEVDHVMVGRQIRIITAPLRKMLGLDQASAP